VGDCVWLGVDDAVPVKDAVIEMVELCVEKAQRTLLFRDGVLLGVCDMLLESYAGCSTRVRRHRDEGRLLD